jgi:hypothetical protein
VSACELRRPRLSVVGDSFLAGDGGFQVMDFVPGDDLAAPLMVAWECQLPTHANQETAPCYSKAQLWPFQTAKPLSGRMLGRHF